MFRNFLIGWVTGFVYLAGAVNLLREAFSSGAAVTAVFPNATWCVTGGAVGGLRLVIPGFGSSSVLIFMGLYQLMIAGF